MRGGGLLGLNLGRGSGRLSCVSNQSNQSQGSGKAFSLALGAYVIWGVFPVLMKPLLGMSTVVFICARGLSCALFSFLVLFLMRRGAALRLLLGSPRALGVLLVACVLIAANWWLYFDAIQGKNLSEASIGYFLLPLLQVLFGWVFLRERLNGLQKIALGLCVGTVAWRVWHTGSLNSVSLLIALSFGLYGVVRKLGVRHLPQLRDASSTLGVESLFTGLLTLPLVFLWQAPLHVPVDAGTWTAMGIMGVATAIPLMLWVAAAGGLSLSTLGMLQYISPSIQLVLSALVYGEVIRSDQVTMAVLLVVALLVYVQGCRREAATVSSDGGAAS